MFTRNQYQAPMALSKEELAHVSGAAGAPWTNDRDFTMNYEAAVLNNPQFAAWLFSQWVHHVADEHSGSTDTTSTGKPPLQGL
jgi:hypothetical protein